MDENEQKVEGPEQSARVFIENIEAPRIKRGLPTTINYPRRCNCGYKLKANESAFFWCGRWTCKECVKGDKNEVPDLTGVEE